MMSSEGAFKPLILLAKQAFFQMSCISLASLKKTLTVFLKSSGTIEGVNSADKWTDPVRNLFKELIVKLLVESFFASESLLLQAVSAFSLWKSSWKSSKFK